MSAQSHPHTVTTFRSQGDAQRAYAVAYSATGLSLEVRSAVEVCGAERRPVFVLAAVTESGAFVASEALRSYYGA